MPGPILKHSLAWKDFTFTLGKETPFNNWKLVSSQVAFALKWMHCSDVFPFLES